MMGSLSLQAIATELHSRCADGDIAVAGVATDSRRVAAGDIYIALRGERFDGHEFIGAAATQGAVAAVVSVPQTAALPQLRVGDTRAALGLIARMNRRRFINPVIGITGSAGKTTCKEMLAAILAQCGPTLATQGNLNNEIGVPLTLLRIAPEHRYAVIEMGAARAGDIAYLCRFAEPDIALITSVLPAHLEGFGSIDGIARTKGEIFAGLSEGGTAVINVDSDYESLWRGLAGERRVITFGLNPAAAVTARSIVRSVDGTRFELLSPAGSVPIELRLPGLHNVRNALAAAAAAIVAGAPLAAIATGLAGLRPVPGRLQSRRGLHGEIVIDDSYNANPGAVRAAIDVLAEYPGVRRLLLGNMAELGPASAALHGEVAAYAAERGIDELWCVGPHAPLQADAFLAASGTISSRHNSSVSARAFADNAALIAALATAPVVAAALVKGSRSAGMEIVVAALCGSSDEAPAGGAH